MVKLTKERIALVTVNVLALIWIIGLFYIEYNKIEVFFDKIYFGPYAFVAPMILPIDQIIAWSVMVSGIFLLPLDFLELGYYDDYEIDNEDFEPSERLNKINKAIKPKYNALKNFVKKYNSIISIALITFGLFFIIFPLKIYPEPTLITIEGVEILSYWAFIRAQYLILGILLILIGSIFSLRTRK